MPDARLRGAIRSAAPPALRMAVALARRAWRDRAGNRPRFAVIPAGAGATFAHTVVTLRQDIRRTAFFAGKHANIVRGAALLDGVVLAPGETLSCWRLIGRPTLAAGFAMGRAIRGGAVAGDIGGGLCQLSGIAYEAGLRAGLIPVERHPHSRDIYREEERFTPLGLDATLVWPYKDLRIANPLPVAVRFRFAVDGDVLVAAIEAPVPLPTFTLDIDRRDEDGHRDVRVTRLRPEPEPISRDRYPAPSLIPG